jgi:hypothetical protein
MFEATAQTWERIRDLAAAHGRDVSQMELIDLNLQPWFTDVGQRPGGSAGNPGAGQSGWRPTRLAALR